MSSVYFETLDVTCLIDMTLTFIKPKVVGLRNYIINLVVIKLIYQNFDVERELIIWATSAWNSSHGPKQPYIENINSKSRKSLCDIIFSAPILPRKKMVLKRWDLINDGGWIEESGNIIKFLPWGNYLYHFFSTHECNSKLHARVFPIHGNMPCMQQCHVPLKTNNNLSIHWRIKFIFDIYYNGQSKFGKIIKD